MTEQAEELTRGEALARVAVLEAELAELRKRVCVPDASTMARVLSDRAASACCVDPDDNWKIYGQEFIEDVRAMLAATPAPVERVEQEAVGTIRTINPCDPNAVFASFQVVDGLGWLPDGTKLYTAPQPAPTADPWKASDVEYDRAIHHNPDAKAWADLFVQTFPAQADQHDLMLGWFSNAMMAMHDWLKTKESPAPTAQDVAGLVEALSELQALRRAYCDSSAGRRDTSAPSHAETIAISELLISLDDNAEDDAREAIFAYADQRASVALDRAIDIVAAHQSGGAK